MPIAALATREEKQKWLLRPFDWALKITLYSAAFGLFFWFEGKVPLDQLAMMAIVALAISAGFITWGFRRLLNVTR